MASNHVAFVTAGGLTNATVAHSLYGYCTTAAGTITKTVTMYKTGSTAGASWAAGDLIHGLTITVRFQYSNTAANPTLNVNSTGAKPIYKYGTTVPGTTADTSWPAQAVIQLTYDTLLNTSGCWVMNDHIDNTNTIYSSLTAANGGTDVSLVTTGEKYTWNSKTSNTGTVTSVRVQATNPVQSSTSTSQSTSLNTTISLASAYGDTQNPYGTKTKNYVLAGPTTGSAAAPTFRALVAADIPDLSSTYLTSYTETDPVFTASAAHGISNSDIINWNNKADGSHTHSSYVNQNAFSNVKVGSTTVAADSTTDTIELIAGSNIALTPDSANDQITIEATDTTYESKTAASGGVAVSLVTTGEKYTWNNKADTDTKNTAGSNASTSKLFLIGAISQADSIKTYSRSTAYIGTDGHLYSNSKQVVNLSDTQALTNKTYNGYTLAAACAKGVDTSISSASSTNLPTTAAVTAYTDDIIVIDENEPTSALTKIWIKI